MIVESLELYNYRNYRSASIEFSPGTNILYGDNAQGKTNLLESVYLCATSRSHKRSKDRDLIRFDEKEAHIRLHFRKDSLSHRMDVHLRSGKTKGMAIDGIPIKRSSDLSGMLPVVFFSPEDLSIIKNGPAERRRFMDMEMSQLDKNSLAYLMNYHRLLSERNSLLRQIDQFPQLRDTLDGWDDQLISIGIEIMKKRRVFLKMLRELMVEIHTGLSGGKEEITVSYDNNCSEEEFAEKLKARRDKDIKNGSTSVGPHRDDIGFQINGSDIRKFGSQGQQRTAALSLKLSEIKMVERIIGEKPVLLLDDVLSELDSSRQQYLLDNISGIQTIITCTGLDDFVKKRVPVDRIFYINRGRAATKE